MTQLSEARTAPILEVVPELDRLAAAAITDWKMPGAALAVVEDGKVALAKANDQRDVEANLPVQPRVLATYSPRRLLSDGCMERRDGRFSRRQLQGNLRMRALSLT